MSAIPTVKIKHNGPLGFCIVNADELTSDMELYGEVAEVPAIVDDMQEDAPETELPPVKVAVKKSRSKAS
jgi:hypothetical protein